MIHDQLSVEILAWAEQTINLPAEALEKTWKWQGYSEGIRFAFFRVLEEIRAMAVDDVCCQLSPEPDPSAKVQKLLAFYHKAYWDLKALCLGLTDETASKKPGEGEWSIKEVIQHTLDADWAFYGIFLYTYRLKGTRKDWNTEKIPESFFDLHFSDKGLYDEQAFEGDLSQLLGLYEKLHRQIMLELRTFRDEQLQDELHYWEPQPMKARFRLIRFEAHLRQHSIQVQKTISALGFQSSGEVRQLVNLCLQAFADLEVVLLFHPELNPEQIRQYWDENVKQYLDVILSALPA